METAGVMNFLMILILFFLVLCPLGYLFYLVCKLIKAWIDKLNRS